jgi:NADH dehydrogenase FAD-containing subunit
LCPSSVTSSSSSSGGGSHVTIYKARVVALHADEHRIETADGALHPYDMLVVATGCSYPSPIKQRRHSDMAAASREEELCAAAQATRRASSVVVVGGGVVGVELAAEIATATTQPSASAAATATAAALGQKVSSPRTPPPSPPPRDDREQPTIVTLVASTPRLLPSCPLWVGERAEQSLVQRGVRVVLHQRVTPAQSPLTAAAEQPCAGPSEDRPQLLRCSRSGEVLQADVCYWCTGGKPNTAFMPRAMLDTRGRVIVDDATLALPSQPGTVYAIGDAAAKPSGRYLASYAHWEAEYVAHVICRRLRSEADHGTSACDASVATFSPPAQFLAISLGPGDGMLLVNGRMWLGYGVTAKLVRPLKWLLQESTLGWPFRAGLSLNPYWVCRWWSAAAAPL